MRRGHQRSGFTLLELVVVVGIILVLMSLLLPLQLKVRATGRTTQCTSNVRQIATALFTYHSVNRRMPWLDSGVYTNVTSPNGNVVFAFTSRNWEETLRAEEYLPSDPLVGVWRCPEVTKAQVVALDANGWQGGRGGYGVNNGLFRTDKTSTGVPNRPLNSGAIRRPGMTWLVGDTGQPESGSEPGSGKYRRVTVSFTRPSRVGGWDFSAAYPPAQPAMRHRGLAVWAAFDGHMDRFDWPAIATEKGNFTARGETP